MREKAKRRPTRLLTIVFPAPHGTPVEAGEGVRWLQQTARAEERDWEGKNARRNENREVRNGRQWALLHAVIDFGSGSDFVLLQSSLLSVPRDQSIRLRLDLEDV